MAAIKWFRAEISVGNWARNIYLYQTSSNLFDLQYHWLYASHMHRSLKEALDDFANGFARHHRLVDRNLKLVIGVPVEVQWSEVEAARPANMPSPYFDPP
jgi:hypothetical protein